MGEGLPDDSGATTGGDDQVVSPLPSAAESGSMDFVDAADAAFDMDICNVDEIDDDVWLDDDFFASSGFVDPRSASTVVEPDVADGLSVSDDSVADDSSLSSDFRIHSVDVVESHLSDSALLTRSVETNDPCARALYLLDLRINATGLSANEYYTKLQAEEDLLSADAPLRVHMDGGSMATTTNRKDYLWHYRPLRNQAVTLRVADETPHYPTGVGFLRVPSTNAQGFETVRCYYTPSMNATILSPDAARRQFECRGYTTVSNTVGGSCSVRLQHCRRVAQDVHFPAKLVRGLLFSEPLIKPTTDTDRTGPRPVPKLHLRRVEQSSPSETSPDSKSCSCCQVSDSDAVACPSCATDSSSPASSDDESSSASVCERDALRSKLLHYQRLGFQPDVSMERLAESVDGFPTWPSATPPVCGHVDTPSSTGEGTLAASTSSAGEGTDSSLPSTLEGLDPKEQYYMAHVTRQQLRLLWHHRLGHIHSRRVTDLHRYADGVPNELPLASELDKCPICAQAKLRKAARGQEDSRRAKQCGQGVSIDFGFLVQASSADSARLRRLQGLNGETCYCLIADHFSGRLFGETFSNKAPPLDFVNRWLTQYGAGVDVPDKYVRFDLGGELGRCRELRALFEKAGYGVETTAADSSNQNAPGERPHQTIGDALRAMLGGADLAPCFWPYAFHHFLRLYNVTVHGDRTESPYEIWTGRRPNLRLLRTFGCRVYALPARPRRPAKILTDARKGLFLGYSKTMKNILYYDLDSEIVKECQHVVFDESMTDLSIKPPNARLLDGLRPDSAALDLHDFTVDVPDLETTSTPFLQLKTITVPLELESERPLGLAFDTCSKLKRVFASAFTRAPVGRSLRATRREFVGSYVVSLDDSPIFSMDDVTATLTRLSSLEAPPATVELVLAPERRSELTSRPGPLHLRMNDLRRVCALQLVAGEGMSIDEYSAAVAAVEKDLRGLDLDHLIARVQSAGMTDEERKLTKFTRRNLQKLSNWAEWDASFDDQLDQHLKDGTFGLPVKLSTVPSDERKNIARIQWSNSVKTDGRRKCRSCFDGSKRSVPWLHQFVQTYSSCIEQPCMRLFFALAAAHGHLVTFADATNAYQQSPPPTKNCYLRIDDAYRSWYRKRFKEDLPWDDYVIPLNGALQGHPEAGVLWETLIVGVLKDLGFKGTTHEPNLYRGVIDGEVVHVCRQVDDFAISSPTRKSARKLIALVNDQVNTEDKGIGVQGIEGFEARYNGVDIAQTRDYIKLSCATYIDRVLQTHGWDKPAPRESDRHDQVPLSPDASTKLQALSGPIEGTPEFDVLRDEVGFSYRQVLGELIYAYVVCRLDIGYAVTLLARFSSAPHREHYTALKNVCRYLRRTKSRGIIYWRPAPLESLPVAPLEIPLIDGSLPEFPRLHLFMLAGFVDAAHAIDMLTRRSVTGYVFTFSGGAIAYKSKLQPTVATSSTESEFIAAVSAAKVAKYLRSVLTELGYPPDGPTPLYEDNQAAIAMINERKPTPRSRHIDIQHFAIQEWRQRKIVDMHYIPGIINPADQATKALGWTLHARHALRAMGYHRP